MSNHISFTQFKMYKTCPKQWEFYALRKLPRKADNRPFFTGKVVHELNEMYMRQQKKSLDQLLEEAPEVYKTQKAKMEVTLKVDEDDLIVYSQIVKSLLTLVRLELDLGLFTAHSCQPEWSFDLPIGDTGYSVVGAADAIYKLTESSPIQVVDFKDSAWIQYQDPAQLYIYCMAYEKITGILPAKAGFVMLKTGNVHWHDIYRPLLETTYQKLVTFVGDIEKIKSGISSVAKPAFENCRRCAYKEYCDRAIAVRTPVDIIHVGGQASY